MDLFLAKRSEARWKSVRYLCSEFTTETVDLANTLHELGGEFIKSDAFRKLWEANAVSAGHIADLAEMPSPKTADEIAEVKRIRDIVAETHTVFADAVPQVEAFQLDLEKQACDKQPDQVG